MNNEPPESPKPDPPQLPVRPPAAQPEVPAPVPATPKPSSGFQLPPVTKPATEAPPEVAPAPAPAPQPVPQQPVPTPQQPAPVPQQQPETIAPSMVPQTTTTRSFPFQATAERLELVKAEVKKVFVGQDEIIEQLLVSLLTGGHLLLEGKPGLGKTHLVLSLAKAIGGNFGRIQFTPDLMPSDVTGHTLYDLGKQEFKIRKGPVFVNLLLADEINRAPAKTQAALLEVMQEEQVTIDGESLKLEPPFLVVATQNPIEQEGTYPLPEAQLDRFLMKVLIDYPTEAEESAIVTAASSDAQGRGLHPANVTQICSLQDIITMQRDTGSVKAVPAVVDYAVKLTRATRNAAGISLGAGTRGAISMVRAAKAYALLEGRDFISPHDVKRAVAPVLRHRVALTPDLLISGDSVDGVLESVVQTVEAPRG